MIRIDVQPSAHGPCPCCRQGEDEKTGWAEQKPGGNRLPPPFKSQSSAQRDLADGGLQRGEVSGMGCRNAEWHCQAFGAEWHDTCSQTGLTPPQIAFLSLRPSPCAPGSSALPRVPTVTYPVALGPLKGRSASGNALAEAPGARQLTPLSLICHL